MTPGTYDLTPYRGDGFAFVVVLTDADNAPLDITGSTFEAQVRATPDATAETAFTVTPEGTSTLRLSLTGEQVAALPRVGVWDLEERRVGLEARTLLAGSVTVRADVTHA